MTNVIPMAAGLPAAIDTAWLERQRPHETDRALEAALMQRFCMTIQLRGRTEQGRLPTREACPSSPTSSPDYAGAVALIEKLSAPADPPRLAKMLATLGELTRGKTEDPDLQLSAYIAKLREYPADIAINALNTWPEKSQWFPTWFELREHMKFWADKRREMLEAVRFEVDKAPSRGA